MKKLLLSSLAILAAGTTAFAAESFRLKKVIGSAGWETETTSIEYDNEGRLSKISEAYETITFDYSRIAEGVITVVEKDNHSTYTYTALLNEKGYVGKFTEDEAGGGDTCTLSYDADGHLSNITIRDLNDDGPEIYDITYADGSITGWKYSDKREAGSYEEESATVANTDYDNKAGFMNLDAFYGIDIDNLEYMAIAGYLGVAPAKLPASVTVTEDDGSRETDTFTWTMDGNNYPSKLKVKNTSDGKTDVYNYEFIWTAASGVESVTIGNGSAKAVIYGLDGSRRSRLMRGVNIVRHADGSTEKVIVDQ